MHDLLDKHGSLASATLGAGITLALAAWTRQYGLVGATTTALSVLGTGYWHRRTRVLEGDDSIADHRFANITLGIVTAGSGLALAALWRLRSGGIPGDTMALVTRAELPILTLLTASYILEGRLKDFFTSEAVDDQGPEWGRRVESAAAAVAGMALTAAGVWVGAAHPSLALTINGVACTLFGAWYAKRAEEEGGPTELSAVRSGSLPYALNGVAITTCTLSGLLLFSRWSKANLVRGLQPLASTVTQAGLLALSLGYVASSALQAK
jgi:hypothetical protein